MASDVMKIVRFTVYTVEIPMRISVSHALAERKVARNILVCAWGQNGLKGWGECCPRPYVTGETTETVKTTLASQILPPMIGSSFCDFEELKEALLAMLDVLQRNQQAAFCAAELAVLDLAGKTFGISSGTLAGPISQSSVKYSGVIATNDPGKVRKYAFLMRLFGMKEIKIKVGISLDKNLQILRAARSMLGENVSIRIDANCAWTTDEAIRQLKAMSQFKLAGVEQPVSAENHQGMIKVTAAKLAPVVADESLCSFRDAERLIDDKACDIFNVRVSKCGGLINSTKICHKAIDSGLEYQLGAQVGETSILSAAGRHIATRCPAPKWCEGSYGRLLLKRDIAKPSVTIGFGGRGDAINQPGLGVEPVEQIVAQFSMDMFEMS